MSQSTNTLTSKSRGDLGASDPLRAFKDKLAQYSITMGGLMVLMTLLMIFGYLLYVVEPVFRNASIEINQSH